MAGTHCTPAEIKQFIKLYEKYGTYTGVRKHLKKKRSVDTISNHIKLYYASQLAKDVNTNEEQKEDGKRTITITI